MVDSQIKINKIEDLLKDGGQIDQEILAITKSSDIINELSVKNRQTIRDLLNMDDLDIVLNLNANILEIGTKEQYMKYLNQIFPNSIFNRITFHGTPTDWYKNETFNPETIKRSVHGKGFYFGSHSTVKFLPFAKNIFGAILDIHNPFIKDNTKPLNNESVLNGKDSVIVPEINVQVVFKSEQIHILGSNADIEGFKKFVKEIG